VGVRWWWRWIRVLGKRWTEGVLLGMSVKKPTGAIYDRLFSERPQFVPEHIMKIQTDLAMYGLGKVSDLLNLLDLAEQKGITVQDMRDWREYVAQKVREKVQIQSRRTQLLAKHFRCPRCDAPLAVIPIGIPQGPGNVYGWRTHLICPQEECSHEQYLRKTYGELMRNIMRIEREKE